VPLQWQPHGDEVRQVAAGQAVNACVMRWLGIKELHTWQVAASGDALGRLVVSGEPQASQC
jgi:hypothetical protein